MTAQYNINRQSWILEVHEDGEGMYLELTDEILENAGWKIGDTLLWEKAAGNAWTIRKKP